MIDGPADGAGVVVAGVDEVVGTDEVVVVAVVVVVTVVVAGVEIMVGLVVETVVGVVVVAGGVVDAVPEHPAASIPIMMGSEASAIRAFVPFIRYCSWDGEAGRRGSAPLR